MYQIPIVKQILRKDTRIQDTNHKQIPNSNNQY